MLNGLKETLDRKWSLACVNNTHNVAILFYYFFGNAKPSAVFP